MQDLTQELERVYELRNSGQPLYLGADARTTIESPEPQLPPLTITRGAKPEGAVDLSQSDVPPDQRMDPNVDWNDPAVAAQYGTAEMRAWNPGMRGKLVYGTVDLLSGLGVDPPQARTIAERIWGSAGELGDKIGLVDGAAIAAAPFSIGAAAPVSLGAMTAIGAPSLILQTEEELRGIADGIEGIKAGREGAYGDTALSIGFTLLNALGLGQLGKTMAGPVKNAANVLQDNASNIAKVGGATAIGGAVMSPDEAEAARLKLPKPSARPPVTIMPPSNETKVLQLAPDYRVTLDGVPDPVGKGQFITNAINPKNVVEQSARLDQVAQEFPDPLASREQWTGMKSRVYNSKEVPIPPDWLIEHVNDMPKWSGWFSKLTPEQTAKAANGFNVSSEFRNLYQSGAGVETTGHLMLWSILSRRMSAFPHEAGFLDLAEAADPFIRKAASGNWGPDDVKAWKEMVQASIPAGSPGRSAISNANAFGETFLTKMAEMQPGANTTKLEALHNMIADPAMNGPEVRRGFYGLAEDVGIKNKVLSFALLVSGRNDVMVLDRIQINQMWGGGKKIYDDVYQLFDNGAGLATYEALERSLGSRVNELYAAVGRPQDASVGRYHWESWVLTSGQEVEHPTLATIVKSGRGEAAPFAGTPVAEGRFHSTLFGASYEKLPGGGQAYVYRTQDGTPYQFSKGQLDDMFSEVMKPKNGVVPKDFPGVKFFEGKDTPWLAYQGVDRGKLDEYIQQYGKPAKP